VAQAVGFIPCKDSTPQAEACATNLSKLDMQAEGWREDRAAVAIVAGVVDVLRIERGEDAAPHVQRVIGFENVFAAIVQVAVAQQESEIKCSICS